VANVPREKPADPTPRSAGSAAPREPAPTDRAPGLVAAVAAMDREAGGAGQHAGIVDRVFGPAPRSGPAAPVGSAASFAAGADADATSNLQPRYADIDVDFAIAAVARKQASVLGAASKVAGDLVCDENVEIEGFVEGGVRARRARVTVGREGLVQSKIEARSVRVKGTVRADVVAEDWVEVKSGGVIRGDVRAPRVILHDGAIVTGRLDMSGAAAARRASGQFDPLVIPPRPRMRKVGGAKKGAPGASGASARERKR